MDTHIYRREISLDYAHRVREHHFGEGSLTGHTGKAEAWVNAEIQDSGESAGQVLDFSFLSGVLVEHVAMPCHHGLILDVHDPLVRTLRPTWSDRDLADTVLAVSARGHMATEGLSGKLYLIPDPPTPQVLARHFYERMKQPVLSRSGGRASLIGVRFWETPESWAGYGPSFGSNTSVLEWEHML